MFLNQLDKHYKPHGIRQDSVWAYDRKPSKEPGSRPVEIRPTNDEPPPQHTRNNYNYFHLLIELFQVK